MSCPPRLVRPFMGALIGLCLCAQAHGDADPPVLALRFVRPSYGSESGGDRVVLRGEGFAGGLSVRFGGRPADAVRVLGGLTAEVTTPAGTGDVEVVLELGGESVALARAFSYVPAEDDGDGDGLGFAAERAAGTDPFSRDTDADGLLDSAETGTGVFAGPEDTGTDPRRPDTDGGGTGDGEEVRLGRSPLDPADDAAAVRLPVTLVDADGFLWDVDRNGQVWSGADDAFDGAAALWIGSKPFPGIAEAVAVGSRRELVLGPVRIAELDVTRRVFVSPTHPLARYLEVFANPGPVEIQATARIATDLGSDAGTVVVATSSGGLEVSASDSWAVTDDAVDSGGDPTILHVWAARSGGLARLPDRVALRGGVLAFEFDLRIPAGGTVALLHLLSQRPDRASARELAALIDGRPRLAAEGMSHALLLGAVNFFPDGDGDGIPGDEELLSGLDPSDPSDAATDLDGDGLSNLQESILGSAMDRADTDGDGISDGEEVSLETDPLREDTDGDGVKDPDDPFPPFAVRVQIDAPSTALAGSAAPLLLRLLGPLGDRIPPPGSQRFILRSTAGILDEGEGAGRILEGSATASVVVEADRGEVALHLEAGPGEKVSFSVDDPDRIGLVASGLREIEFLDPTEDSDKDGLPNEAELLAGTDPRIPDTDGDGLLDGVETGTGVYLGPWDTGTDPLSPDSDRDGAQDGLEVSAGTDPLDPSSAPVPLERPPELTGKILRIGLNLDGSLITEEGGLGLRYDPPGPAPETPDLLEPGVPFEAFGIAWTDGASSERSVLFNGAPDQDVGTSIPVATYQIRAGERWTVASFGQAGPLALSQTVDLRGDSSGALFRIQMENRGQVPLLGVSYVRSADVDDGESSPATENDVIERGAVASRALADGVFVLLGSLDPRAVASVEGFGTIDPERVLDSPIDPDGRPADETIHLAFRLGDLAPGERCEIIFVYAVGAAVDECLGVLDALYDSDGDSIADAVEVALGLDPLDPSDGREDLDGDGLTNSQEADFGSRLDLTDTDGDGLTDRQEYDRHLNPRLADTDGDGVEDAEDPFPAFRLRGKFTVPSGGLQGAPAPIRFALEGEGGEKIPPDLRLSLTLRASAGAFLGKALLGEVRRGAGTRQVEALTSGGELVVQFLAAVGVKARIEAIDSGRLGVQDAEAAWIEFLVPQLDADLDGLSNAEEVARGTSPRLPDSDGDGLIDAIENGNGFFLGPWATGSDPARPDTDGDGIDDGLEVFLGLSPVNAADGGKLLPLPTRLPSSDYYLPAVWDIQGTGEVASGTAHAYEGGLKLSVGDAPFPSFPSATLVERRAEVSPLGTGSELILGPATLDGFRVWRRIHVPQNDRFARYLEIIENPSELPRTARLRILTLLGSEDRTTISYTSNGDGELQSDDLWLITDDGYYYTTPAVLHAFRGSLGGARVTAVLGSGGVFGVDYEVDVPPRSRVGILHVAGQSVYDSDLQDLAARAALLEAPVSVALTREDRRTARNYFADSDLDGIPDHAEVALGLDPAKPADGLLDADGDGLANAVEFLLGSDPLRSDSDGDSLADPAEIRRSTDPLLADTDGDGMPDADDQFGAFVVHARILAPRGSLEGEPIDVVVRLETPWGGPLPAPGRIPLSLRATEGAFGVEAYAGRVLGGGGTREVLLESDDSRIGIPFLAWPGRGVTVSLLDTQKVGFAAIAPLHVRFFWPDGDPDGDGLLNSSELALGTWPLDRDSDHDGLDDDVETGTGVFVDLNDTGTRPNDPDTDGDGLPDGAEVSLGSSPLDAGSTPPPLPGGVVFSGRRLLVGLGPAATLFEPDGQVGLRLRGAGSSNFGDEMLAAFPPDFFALRAVLSEEEGDLWLLNGVPVDSPLIPLGVASYLCSGSETVEVVSVGEDGPLTLVQTIALGQGDSFVRFAVKISNRGTSPIRDLRYLRQLSADPVWRGYECSADVLRPGLVALWREESKLAIALGSDDPRAVASAEVYSSHDPDPILQAPTDPNGDPGLRYLHLAFRLGTLAPGESTELAFAIAAGETLEEAMRAFDLERDADHDGLPDTVESSIGLDPDDASDALGDLDSDGLSNLDEYHRGTRPDAEDTDGDGMDDGIEVRLGLDPLSDDAAQDPDGDLLANADEAARGTDPFRPDTDGDGVSDGLEISSGLNPLDAADGEGDLDGDGLTNAEEAAAGTCLERADTDCDGLPDSGELDAGLDPLVSDTDGDGLADGEEVLSTGTDPLHGDTDGDAFPDWVELKGGSDPADPLGIAPGALHEDFASGAGALQLLGAAAADGGALVLASPGEPRPGGAYSAAPAAHAAFFSECTFEIQAGEQGRAHGLALILSAGEPRLGGPGESLGLGGLEGPALVVALELARGREPFDHDRIAAGYFEAPLDVPAPGEILALGASVELLPGLAAPGEVRLTIEAEGGWATISLERLSTGDLDAAASPDPPTAASSRSHPASPSDAAAPFRVELEAPLEGGLSSAPSAPGLVATSGPSLGGIRVHEWLWQPTGTVRLRSVLPESGPASGGTEVRILGSGFDPPERWRAFLGLRPLEGIRVESPVEIRALTPASVEPGPADLLVLGPSGAARMEEAYLYGPLILGVDPPSGGDWGGGRVRVYVAGLGAGDSPEVFFGEGRALVVSRPLEDVLVVEPPPGDPDTTVGLRVVGATGEAELQGAYTFRRTVWVPEEFEGIDQAVRAAPDGALIDIGPGSYAGSLDLAGRRLELRGRQGYAETVMSGSASTATIRLSGKSAVTLRGLTITSSGNMTGNGSPGGAVSLEAGSRCEFVSSSVSGNRGLRGGGIRVGPGASLAVTRSRIIGNRSSGPGGGILVEKGGAATLVSSLIASNAAEEEGGGIAVLEEEPGAVRISWCTFSGNTASTDGGGIFEAAAGAAEVTGCLFWENRAGDRPDDLSPGWWRAVRNSMLGTETLAGVSRNVFSGGIPVPFDPSTYEPLAGSPAVDAGRPGLVCAVGCLGSIGPVDPEGFADLHGLPRSLDGDGDGRSLPDLGALELGPRPRVSLEAKAAGEGNALEVSFQALVEGPWDSAKWDFGDGAPPVYGALSVVHRYSAAGTYAVSVVVGLLDDSAGARIEVVVGSEYIRGDCDGDGAVNITDAIGLLNFLFRTGSVGCLAACDADGGGSLNITDPIRILLSLFMDWGPLVPPRYCGDVSAPTTFTCLESICRN